jgi:hypothetical protein
VQGKKDKLLNCVEENIPHIDRIIKRWVSSDQVKKIHN